MFAPLANLPVGNSIVFAPFALLCFIMALLTLEGSIESTLKVVFCHHKW